MTARRIVTSLRLGIPPEGHVRSLTVGRQEEIGQLGSFLSQRHTQAVLLRANYGAGKSHLLRYIREAALDLGYAVSSVTLDCNSAVRFNRMDQILGAIMRNLEVPDFPGERGIARLFDIIEGAADFQLDSGQLEEFWADLTDDGTWARSYALDSPAMFVAVRAWWTGHAEARELVQDWLHQPWEFKNQRAKLYHGLVGRLRSSFRDPRSDKQFYISDVFNFSSSGYQQSWAAIRDLEKLAVASGLSGLVILFDEFEDVVTNLRNIGWQESAFENLFEFFNGRQARGMSFFAVTPEFTDKCKELLLRKGRWDYDYSAFDALTTFEMSPLDAVQVEELAERIVGIHALAFEWNPRMAFANGEMRELVDAAMRSPAEDRVRKAIKLVVSTLDENLPT